MPVTPNGTIETIHDLRRRAEQLTGNRPDADDLVQEAMVRALTYVKDGHQVRNWRAYMNRIVHNLFFDQLSQRARRGREVEIDDAGPALMVPECQYHRHRLRELGHAISALPAPQREVVRLVGVNGLSYRDAADRLGVPIGTVMSRLHRGRETLRARMDGEGAARPENGPPHLQAA